MSFRNQLRSLQVVNAAELAAEIGAAVPIPPSAGAIGTAVGGSVPQGIDIGNGVNARTPWESGQIPLALASPSVSMTSDGAYHDFSWAARQQGGANLGGGSYTVPNGYRCRITSVAAYVDTNAASGSYPSGILGLRNYCEVPFGTNQEPCFNVIRPDGLEFLGGQPITPTYLCFARSTFGRVVANGFLYVP